jgi:opacity protein-like surface antigen
MMRVTRFALVWTAILLTAGVTAAQAQTTPSEEGRYYAEFAVAATLGHKSDSSVGGEFGVGLVDHLWLTGDRIEVFLEGGRMGNVGTTDLDARARTIANFINGSTSAVQKAKFFDVGVKYRGPVFARMWRPYIGIGVGVAKVETIVNFAVNGTDVTSQLSSAYGIELGNDLSDSLNKTFITVPVGVQGNFRRRYFVDGSYRFGTIRPRPDDIDRDVAITTQRVQVGVGVRF